MPPEHPQQDHSPQDHGTQDHAPQHDALLHLDAHYQAMPPVAALRMSISGYDGTRLRLHAPLAANVNDKGCAFGGSLASLMTLASWGLVAMRVQAAGLSADVFVADTQVRYLAPLFADIEAEAELAADASWDEFIATLRERGRARTQLVARIMLPKGVLPKGALPEGGVAATCSARYVAIARG